jgi:hypothetical protein
MITLVNGGAVRMVVRAFLPRIALRRLRPLLWELRASIRGCHVTRRND